VLTFWHCAIPSKTDLNELARLTLPPLRKALGRRGEASFSLRPGGRRSIAPASCYKWSPISYQLSAKVLQLFAGETVSSNAIANSFHTVGFGLNYRIAPAYEPLK
jgi:hypothetical protein